MKHLERIGPALLLLFSIAVSIILAYTATQRTLSGLESVLWQIFVFAGGLAGSFMFGRQSAREAAKEMIKPHARSAFRRLVSLYESFSRASSEIQSLDNSESPEDYRVAFAKLDAIVTEQLTTADDALEDWRDVVPEDVEELKQKLESDNTRGNRQ